jgi:hypothetical protein
VNRRPIILLAGVALALAACQTTVQSLSNDQTQTDAQLQQYQKVQPVPFYNWSEQRNTLIQIYNAKNEARQTWAVFMSYTGTAMFTCPSIGFPIPADTQLTNPEQIARTNVNGTVYSGVVGQMEPDGLYSSTGTSGTYVLCVRDNGKAAPIYWEPPVAMFPYEVKIVNGQIIDAGGTSNIEVDVKGAPAGPAPSTAP